MIILDEQTHRKEYEALKHSYSAVHRIGVDIGYTGMSDAQIINLLHSLQYPTFFTYDSDFYKPRLRHNRYCLVFLDVNPLEIAKYARKVLRYPEFNTRAKRMGYLIRASPEGLTVWPPNAQQSLDIKWLT
jgi:hypothetical protein